MISQPMQNPPGPGYPAPPATMQQYQPPPTVQTSYAGFWIRLVSRLVDGFIVGVPLTVILFIFVAIGGALGANTSDQNSQSAATAVLGGGFTLFYVLALVATVGYQVYFWGTSGQTIAMRLFHLKVVDANTGGPIGIGRAVVRWLMTIVNTWACYVGWIWVAFDARKQGWHDKVASSVVLQIP